MPQNLPSKKVFAVAFLAIGVLGWTIVSKYYGVSLTPGNPAYIIAVAHAESALQDSDNDDLPDWQEALFGVGWHQRWASLASRAARISLYF